MPRPLLVPEILYVASYRLSIMPKRKLIFVDSILSNTLKLIKDKGN